jgi:hypothetical protein
MRRNKVQKSDKFVKPEKCPSTHHDSPQIHHTFTTIYHPENNENPQNPLQNYPFASPKFFSSIPIEKLRETCSYP